ncbi:type II toxin-antitoxin system RelE/ParE family toxin [Porticoccus sp. W117]|uniref:type II toxin-antitoxin system RelE/ParE family toxin n=1 Tax=Porticoccus sp. W117 TaxID=3054777 RepID=UPI00259552E1|nr:type II toxin-antitoxin system RelE/ParE family toxin [Porticoccus sp. W117]MDM3871579.1 type II toxin-antitoxin system RelE/ParE family toxin [Porticoccus sp. W117]
MANNFYYSKRAEKQVQEIFLYTASKWGVSQAEKYDKGLENTLQLLADNPDMGRKCDDLRKGYHRHEYGRHIIFYRKYQCDIQVMSVIFDSANIQRYFGHKGNA